jgi:hypothetical protein
MVRKGSNLIGLFSILSVFIYALFFSLSRKLFTQNLLTYTALFALFLGLFFVFKRVSNSPNILFQKLRINRWQWSGVVTVLFITGLIFRFTALHVTPNLSQDFFRFIWDGYQLLAGFSPYATIPDDIIATQSYHIPHANFLHEGMGALSSGHHSSYPPLNQFFFALSSGLGYDNLFATMMWMRVFIILADIGIFVYGIKLLRMMGKPAYLIALYYLNPFVIIELTGNLHWEGMMAFFSLLSIYYLLRWDTIKSALFLGNGILIKLMPVLILPLLFRYLPFKKLVVYYLFTGFVVVLAFVPFLSLDIIENYGSSVGLWFGTFEFNASIYYIVRAVGFEIMGYNIIGTAAKILPIITIIVIGILSVYRKNNIPEVLLSSIVFSFFSYYLLSTTVHPWYLTIPLLFSIFTKYRFMILWSFTVFLSYYAYGNEDYQESMWMIALEYGVVVAYLIYELFFTDHWMINEGKLITRSWFTSLRPSQKTFLKLFF